MINLKQKAALACVVTGEEWIICTFGPNGGGTASITDKNDPCNKPLWKPAFKGNDKQKAQACDVACWVGGQIDAIETDGRKVGQIGSHKARCYQDELDKELRKALADKNTEGLIEIGIGLL